MGATKSKIISNERLNGKTVVVTGATSHIGKMVVKHLYRRGARVLMACLGKSKAEAMRDDIKRLYQFESLCGELVIVPLDLASFKAIRRCANDILMNEQYIHVLINGANVVCDELMRTKEGLELHLGINHLGHFLLTLLLLPKIMMSCPARIINIAARAHIFGSVYLDDMNWKTSPYSSFKAYHQSQIANVMFTKELAKRLKNANVNVYAVHVGFTTANASRYFPSFEYILSKLEDYIPQLYERGALNIIYCATSDNVDTDTGKYYVECTSVPAKHICNRSEVTRRLWIESCQYVGIDESKVFPNLTK